MAYTTIKKPSDYFNTKLYSGTGSSQAVTGVGFQPDWIWFKCRTQNQNHNLFDAIRGSNKIIQSSTSNAEATSTALLTSFDSDGFTVNTDGGVNGSGQTYASWNWLANGAGSANTDGDINSTVSANTTSGFSIVSYTGNGVAGATIGHGLGVAPSMIIEKIRSTTGNWLVYHHKNTSAPATEFVRLNQTNATDDELTIWNDTAPTSSVFSVGTESTVNGNGNTCIAYCFAEKQGFSKFGSYTGNGNADGTFVYTGMKPSFVMIKRTDSTASWLMFDNKRANPFNEITADLRADSSQAEDASTSYNTLDFLSNGFKIRKSNADINASGASYIYMAFAEQPLVGDNPATAR